MLSPSPAAREHADAIDLDAFRLRTFVERLPPEEIDVRDGVKLTQVAQALDGHRKAVLFTDAGGPSMPLAANVIGARSRFARAFGVAPGDLATEVLKRLGNTPKVVEIAGSGAPVQQVVRVGEDADLLRLPIHLQHGYDGGPYVTASMDFCLDRKTGWTNVGLRRLMLRGHRETGIDLTAPTDLRAMYQASAARREKLPVSFVVGAHPIDYLAASMRIPVDELGLISTLRAAPLPVVRCVTNDIRVPADAEWVIEGYLDEQGYREPEGPFGEVLGYYGGVKINPVFHVTAITHRRDAMFQTLTLSGRTLGATDSAQLMMLRTEVLVWQILRHAIREPLAVYVPPSTGGAYNVRIAMRQRVPGEARNAIAAVHGSLANAKNVFVVDPDIDVFSDEQIEWALATRFQPHRDLVVSPGFRTSVLDPSLDGAKTGSKAGFDLTLPFGDTSLELRVPEPPRYQGQRYPTVKDALRDGPKFFEELVAAVASEDGREIVAALDALRGSGALTRDPSDGRYRLSVSA